MTSYGELQFSRFVGVCFLIDYLSLYGWCDRLSEPLQRETGSLLYRREVTLTWTLG